MAVTEYIGPLVGPVFADPAEWSPTRSYEALTIVLNEGNSYTARQDVPIGVPITNEDYWLETGNYNAQLEAYRKEVLKSNARIASNTDAISEASNRIASNTNAISEASNMLNSTFQTYEPNNAIPYNTAPRIFFTSQNIATNAFGNQQNAVGQSIKINAKNNIPEIDNAPTEYIAKNYKSYDSVGQFIENNFYPYSEIGNSDNILNVNSHEITFKAVPKTLQNGSFILFNDRQILSKVIKKEDNKITVDGYYSTIDGSIITAPQITNYQINPISRIWGQNINIQFPENSEGSGVCAEYGVVNSNHSNAQGEGITVIAQDGNALNGVVVNTSHGIDYNPNNSWNVGFNALNSNNGFMANNCITAFNASCFGSTVIIPSMHYAFTVSDRTKQTGYIHYDASYGGFFKNVKFTENNDTLYPEKYGAYMVTTPNQTIYLPKGRTIGDTVTVYNYMPVNIKPTDTSFIINWSNGSSNDNVEMPENIISNFIWDGGNWFTNAPLYIDSIVNVTSDNQEIALPENSHNGVKVTIIAKSHNFILKAPSKYPINCNDANIAANDSVNANPTKKTNIFNFVFYENAWISGDKINV